MDGNRLEKKYSNFSWGIGKTFFPFFLLQEVAEKSLMTVQLVEMIRQKTLRQSTPVQTDGNRRKNTWSYIPYGSEEMGQNNDPLSSQAVF